MCGICGVVNFDRSEPVNACAMRRMTDTIAHRGPDDEGWFVDGNVGLGHRRLSIIDLSGGAQPMFNEDSSAVIVFNGEIYNHADLAADLIGQGHVFQTRCDTEAIIHSYEQYGPQCVEKFRGMFAFAIWDRREQRLMLARDRLGIKPLYYYQGDRFLAFASEIKALLELPSVPRVLDHDALQLYLSLRYVPGPMTMFKGIRKLQPGHTLVVDRSGVNIHQYWDVPHPPPLRRKLPEVLDEFRQLLEESVRLRLMAEVPLGVFLSGGLDSSAILAVMSKLTGGKRIKTFSVGYEGASQEENDSNEFAFAGMAAKAFGSDHHEFRLTAQDFGDFIPSLVWHLDEPLADPSCIPLYFISKLARNYITVVLSGEGADEILGGYGIYNKMLMVEQAHRFLGPLAPVLAPQLARWIPGEARRINLRRAGLPLKNRYQGVSRGFRPEMMRQLLPDAGDSVVNEDALLEIFGNCFRQTADCGPLERMLYADTKVWLPDDILMKADKMTMANALELRVPFLDHKLVEFAASLPQELKLNRGQGKFLLREAMRGILPEPILQRSKKGFPVPTKEWFREPLRDLTHDVLLSSTSACRRQFESRIVEGLLGEHDRGMADRSQEIWTLMIFEFWHRQFMDGEASVAGMHTEQAIEVGEEVA